MKPSHFVLLAFYSVMASATSEDLRACSDVEIHHVQDEMTGPDVDECAQQPSLCDSIACKTTTENIIEAFPNDCYIPAGIVDYRNVTQAMIRQDANYYCPNWNL